jgi:hypothetical protein
MDLIDQIQAIATKIERQREHIQTEEATKNAFVLPFISALGYDVFDPTEVVPEFTADVGIKKGEKVDYAIFKDGKLALLFECKPCHTNLDDTHASQLFRYFSVTEARIAVLTNGIIYRFFTDLENSNKMDSRPFLEIDLLDIHEPLILELKRLAKASFNLEDILSTASDLKYMREMRLLLEDQLREPSEEFVRFITSQVYTGRMTQAVLEQFTATTKRALHQFINDQISKRLQSALGKEEESSVTVRFTEGGEADDNLTAQGSRIETTDEEIEGYHIVKSILRETVDPKRIAARDTVSYFGILLDNSNRKTICQLHFNRRQKYIGLVDQNRNEQRQPIEDLNDIYQFAKQLKATVNYYDHPPYSNVAEELSHIKTNDVEPTHSENYAMMNSTD